MDAYQSECASEDRYDEEMLRIYVGRDVRREWKDWGIMVDFTRA